MTTAAGADNALKAQLETWTAATFGSGYAVANVASLGGHSGVTIGFEVRDGTRVVERLVLKMAPPGVAQKNNFDMLRQVPLLQALEANDIPAPRIRWYSDRESAFGAPYLMMSRLAGASPPDLFREAAAIGVANAEELFDQAVDVLVAIHAIDTGAALAGWNVARDAVAEIEHWASILRKTSDRDWLRLGLEVRDLLHRTQPQSMPRGLVHGDYYSNNWVFAGTRLSGVVDWEGASIGPSLLDLGWLYMMYEPQSWGPSRRVTMDWQPEPERLVARYAERSQLELSDLDWYRALGGYRLSCISAYYFEEHRSGRRPNPVWNMFYEAYPHMLGQASRLLQAREA